MNINKYETFYGITKNKNKSNKLPNIYKITPIRTIFDHSSPSQNLLLNQNQLYFNPKKSQIFRDKNIKTKLYRVNDYLSMTNKGINPFSSFNTLNMNRRNQRESHILKIKNNRSDIKTDIVNKPFNPFYRNNSTGSFNFNDSTHYNFKKLNLFNIISQRGNLTKSNSSYNDSTINNNQITNKANNYNNNNDIIIKKINNYNLNLLKNSRFFSKTKYINGIKDKIKNNQRHINKSLSTKNISLENTGYTSVHKTFNDIVVEKLLNKQKNIEEYNKKVDVETMTNKADDASTETNDKKNLASFFDYIPLILQHLKQKEVTDELNKENEYYWLYSKLKNAYNDNSSENTKNSSTKNTNKKPYNNSKDILQNPIVRYLFLERTLANLRHTVKFIDINNRKELELKVLKVMREEYDKIKENPDINDFTTYGYEFDPKAFIKFKQKNYKQEVLLYEINKRNIGIQKNMENREMNLSGNRTKKEFFTTHKSEIGTNANNDYNNNDEIINDIKNMDLLNKGKSNSDKGGLLGKIMINRSSPKKIRTFKTIINKTRNIQKVFTKTNSELKNTREIDEVSKGEGDNENFTSNDNEISKYENEMEKNFSSTREIFPLFENEKLKLNQPIINEEVSKLENDIKIEEKKEDEATINNIDIHNENLVNDVKDVNDVNIKSEIKRINKKKKKSKKKKKVIKTKSSEKGSEKDLPAINYSILTGGPSFYQPEEKKEEEPKKEIIIKDKDDYERYKEEKKKQNKIEKESKNMIFNAIKQQDKKLLPLMKRKKSALSELLYSASHKPTEEDENKYEKKKFEKKKKEEKKDDSNKEIKENEEDEEEDIIVQLKKKKKTDQENGEEEEEESVYSSIDNNAEFEELDISKDMENNGEIVQKKWIDNSPKFKNRIIEYTNRRRMGMLNDNHDMFNDFIRHEKINELNEKMRKVYEKVEKKRKELENQKKKKRRPYNFFGVDLTSVDAIEKKKKVFLNRMREDIRYKINEGKYHLIEMDNFYHFEDAMNKFKLKNADDSKKVKLYVNLVEKYFHFYQNELESREKEKMDEDRINRFLKNLKQELLVTLPHVKEIKGKYCRSVDYFEELQKLSKLYDF